LAEKFVTSYHSGNARASHSTTGGSECGVLTNAFGQTISRGACRREVDVSVLSTLASMQDLFVRARPRVVIDCAASRSA